VDCLLSLEKRAEQEADTPTFRQVVDLERPPLEDITYQGYTDGLGRMARAIVCRWESIAMMGETLRVKIVG
jgi:hypothetical protein